MRRLKLFELPERNDRQELPFYCNQLVELGLTALPGVSSNCIDLTTPKMLDKCNITSRYIASLTASTFKAALNSGIAAGMLCQHV
jgi:hypothetical protein